MIAEEVVKAQPTKNFFINVLTRDIELQDAILDLLDNCIDGIERSKAGDNGDYSDFHAEINFDENGFSIRDNCGGIPKDIFTEYAFCFGRPEERNEEEEIRTIGTYGIGMKRAVLKIGNTVTVATRNGREGYKSNITPEWLAQDGWKNLPLEGWDGLDYDGTEISVSGIYNNIKASFRKKIFRSILVRKIAEHYSLILDKGFSVKVNGADVRRKDISFLWDDQYMQPSYWEGEIDGVDVSIIVGFYGGIPSTDEIIGEEDKKRASEKAGWTVICNDRIVLYCDKTPVTGWGAGRIPNYHTQFISIAGVVSFGSNKASLLPLTTTKRGVESTSSVYVQARSIMDKLLRKYIDYTNHWKGHGEIAKKHTADAKPLPLKVAIEKSAGVAKAYKSKFRGRIYQPNLPKPKLSEDSLVQIRFYKPVKDVNSLGLFLFEDEEKSPHDIGTACFERVLSEAEKK